MVDQRHIQGCGKGKVLKTEKRKKARHSGTGKQPKDVEASWVGSPNHGFYYFVNIIFHPRTTHKNKLES